MRKGQIEFITILGIILLLIVVVYFAAQGNLFSVSPVPRNIYQYQMLVKTSIQDLIRNGASQILERMETQGGYLTPPQNSVRFMGEMVPYWQKCQYTFIPSRDNIRQTFESGLEEYIKKNLNELKQTFSKNVTFGSPKVRASIQANKIDISVYLPTSVSGYQIEQPYKVSIPTKFGEILSFAEDFSKSSAEKRFFDIFTITSIYFSKGNDPQDDDNYGYSSKRDDFGKLPTYGVLATCGETLYRSNEEINNNIKEIVEYVLTNTMWWRSLPVDFMQPKTYTIQSVNGKQYRDLDIQLLLPDGFKFELPDYILYVNTKRIYQDPPHYVPFVCVYVFNKTYTFQYPIVLRIFDPLTKYTFNFASLVDINGSDYKLLPGECATISGVTTQACKDLECTARIKVVDELSIPLKDAFAAFNGCPIGRSDDNGVIEGPVDCGPTEAELDIYYMHGYEFFSEKISSEDINNTYVLHKSPNLTIHFRQVNLIKRGYVYDYEGIPYEKTCHPCDYYCKLDDVKVTTCEIKNITYDYVYADFKPQDRSVTYSTSNINSSTVPDECMESEACNTCINGDKSDPTVAEKCSQCSSQCQADVSEHVNVDYIPGGLHTITAILRDRRNNMKEIGKFVSDYNINRETKDIYMNIPKARARGTYEFEVKSDEVTCLENVLKECGIEPIEEEKHMSVIKVKCTCEDIDKWLLPELVNRGCLTEDEANDYRNRYFCTCPQGGSYPQSCDEWCGDDFSPPCVLCCDTQALNQLFDSLKETCRTEVICT